jgi:hypothetical protein
MWQFNTWQATKQHLFIAYLRTATRGMSSMSCPARHAYQTDERLNYAASQLDVFSCFPLASCCGIRFVLAFRLVIRRIELELRMQIAKFALHT